MDVKRTKIMGTLRALQILFICIPIKGGTKQVDEVHLPKHQEHCLKRHYTQ